MSELKEEQEMEAVLAVLDAETLRLAACAGSHSHLDAAAVALTNSVTTGESVAAGLACRPGLSQQAAGHEFAAEACPRQAGAENEKLGCTFSHEPEMAFNAANKAETPEAEETK